MNNEPTTNGKNSDNIGVRLDTIADMLDWGIKKYDAISEKIGNLYEIEDSVQALAYPASHPVRVAIKQEIDTLQTECNYWAARNDADYKRYNDDLWTYKDLHGDYIPERGADWHPSWAPNWGSSVEYDDTEPNWDTGSRHDSNEGW